MRAKSANTSVVLPDAQFRAIGRALADPHRYSILQQVASADGLACSLLEEHTVLSRATVSHHMKELSVAGLIEIRRDGRDAYLSLHRPVLDAYLERLSSL
jgi:ArsR family transcriptional regulator, arsenate/arsenite/antimonite-responsive transcriptional repressor